MAKRKAHWTANLRGQTKQRGTMNKTEAEWAALLTARKQAGDVLWFAYEAVTLKLATGARYTPDFAVMLADGELELHEVKGFWAEAAKVRIKVAAELFPFRFVAWHKRTQKEGGGWVSQEF